MTASTVTSARLQAALRDEAIGITEISRVATLRAICHDQWDAVGDVMAVRLLRSSQISFLAGAYAAAAICAVASVRNSLGAELAARSSIDGTVVAEVPVADLLDALGAGDGAERSLRLRGLAAIESRYLNWHAPFADNSIEAQLQREGADGSRMRGLYEDAPDVMYRDAAFALEAAMEILSATDAREAK